MLSNRLAAGYRGSRTRVPPGFLKEAMPTVKELLQKLDLGKSVAEFDEDLEEYFIETEAFRSLVNDRIDIIAGDKGTGKTAIFRILQKRFAKIESLKAVEVVPAFNPRGSSIFEKLGDQGLLSEAEYNDLWKAYFLALVGNWILTVWGDKATPAMKQLDQLLRGLELREADDSPATIFQKILKTVRPFFSWKSAAIEYSVTPDGRHTFIPKVEFSKESSTDGAPEDRKQVPVNSAFRLLDNCIREADIVIWIAVDRLDEAFQGAPTIEIPALRALFRAYLDLIEFPHLRLKLFVRRDLFRRITAGGFVNLTHVNARKFEVIWDEEDLLSLLCRRVRKNVEFCREIGIEESTTDRQLFDRLFPQQVDYGKRKPKTWTWIMRRIRDGKDIKPPRNLIDLVIMSQQAQLRSEDRAIREYDRDNPIFEPDALRRALRQLSEQRVNDTLMAEAGIYASTIERFRDGKAEHNEESLARVLGINSGANVRSEIRPLVEMGFLEEIKGSFKIPSLYREGLQITQGKAFSDSLDDVDEDED